MASKNPGHSPAIVIAMAKRKSSATSGPQKGAKPFLFETVLLFIALDALNYLFFKKDPGFMKFPLHPYWVVLLLIPSRYGFLPGFAAGLLTGLHYLLFLVHGMPSRAGLEKLIESGQLALPIAFILTGTLLGEIRQQYLETDKENRERLIEKEESLRLLKQNFENVEKARHVLEARIVGETTTIKTLYEAAKKFETFELQGVYAACLDILESQCQVGKASFYRLEGDHWLIKVARGWEEAKLAEGKIPKRESLMEIAREKAGLVTVRDILSLTDSQKYTAHYGEVLAMVPVKNDTGVPVGVVNIEKMDFLAFTKPNLQLIELVVDWCGKAVSRIEFLKSAEAGRIFDPVYEIFNFQFFEKVLASEFLRARKYRLPLTVSVIKVEKFGFYNETVQRLLVRTLVALLKKELDETDMIFRHRFDGTFAALSPMRSEADMRRAFESVTRQLKSATGKDAAWEGEIKVAAGFSQVDEGMKTAADLAAPALRQCHIAVFEHHA